MLGTRDSRRRLTFPSPDDVTLGNDAMLELCAREPDRVRMFATVNPNYTAHALARDRAVRVARRDRHQAARQPPRRRSAARSDRGARGRTSACRCSITSGSTARREWPSQEISDGADLARLAARHPRASFILAHIGGGGDYMHTFAAVRDMPNIYPDLSGSGVDRGMLDAALDALGAERLLWGSDLTMCTGLAKLRALDVIGLSDEEIDSIRWRNAARIFPRRELSAL